MPALALWINGQPYDGVTPVPAGATVSLHVVPDSAFRTKHPQDARYEIDAVETTILRNGEVQVQPVLSLQGRDIRNGVTLGTNWSPGDQVSFRVTAVARKNFKGKRFPESTLTEAQRSFVIEVH